MSGWVWRRPWLLSRSWIRPCRACGRAPQPRTLLEIAIVRICHLENLEDLADLIEQLRHGRCGAEPCDAAPARTSVRCGSAGFTAAGSDSRKKKG